MKTLVPILIFSFALACRMMDFNCTSITYDEQVAKDSGPWLQLLKAGNFSSTAWGYGKPQSVIPRWLYGVLPEELFAENPSDPYEVAGARLVAAILGSTLVVVVYFFGRELGGATVGTLAAVMFSLFPAVLGHDRIAAFDLPARLASVLSAWRLAHYFRTGSRRSWGVAAICAGLSLACYLRVGVLTLITLLAALGVRWAAKAERRTPSTALEIVAFGFLSLVSGWGLFVVTWPYAWTCPIGAFLEVFSSPARIAQAGPSLEWFFGNIRPLPFAYYPIVYLVMMPLGVLVLHLFGLAITWGKARRGEAAALLWGFVFVPLVLSSFSFRSSLNHYLLICFPATCVLAAIGIQRLVGFRVLAASCAIGAEAIIATSIHPYHLEFFNVLVGGAGTVAARHIFMTGWYGEGIKPLFQYVNEHAPSGATVNCRLGPWPGMGDLKRNLRADLRIQGHEAVNPRGADFVLRVGMETCGEFYRWQPGPEYTKVKDIDAMGGSIGDVWQRTGSGRALYSDDFSTPQMQLCNRSSNNLSLNVHSDGKLFPLQPGKLGHALLCIPSAVLGEVSPVQIRANVRIMGGIAQIRCGTDPASLAVVATGRHGAGTLESSWIPRPPNRDLWVSLAMLTHNQWDQNPRTFWKYDWFDSVSVWGPDQK